MEDQNEDKRIPLPEDASRYFDCLGHDHGVFYFRLHATNHVRDFCAEELKPCHFLEMAPLKFWKRSFPVETGVKTNWDAAVLRIVDALIGACYERGIYARR